jgi:NAD(P)-dependent dehydrogenase (short-subunit alcohol dehydrogenase family)
MRSVVVTGVSTGIGRSSAKVLLNAGFRVFGSVRREEDAERLRTALGPNFTPLIFDVTDRAAVGAAAERVATALGGETLAGLVNNAGVAVAGPLSDIDIDAFRGQLDVNVVGTLFVTQAFLPLLGLDRARKGPPGRVVMMSSVGGRKAWPFAGAYYASKFALEGLSQALRFELMPFDVDVVVLQPGMVVTPIWDKADAFDAARYRDTPYAIPIERLKAYLSAARKNGLPADAIGEAVKEAILAPQPKARRVVAPNPVSSFVASALPRRLVDGLVARRLGLKSAGGGS